LSDEKKSTGYLENFTGEVNYVWPKGMLGYTGKTPNFSTKVMVELWMLQIFRGFSETSSAEPRYGKELIDAIEARTRIPGVFKGYRPSEGVVFSVLRQWTEEGVIELVSEVPVPGTKLRNKQGEPLVMKEYCITELGLERLEEMKTRYHNQVIAGAMVFNRLHNDLFNQDLVTEAVTIEVPQYRKDLPPIELPEGFEEIPTDKED
jgi:DNA-binding PadR family transcriptional regulator